MRQHPRHVRRELQHLRSLAHEKELKHALHDLDDQFDAWKREVITTAELCDEIHHFHDGPSRDLFNFYNRAPLDLAVAHAIARGVIDEDEASPEVREVLSNVVSLCRATGV